jgi:hypothetical protein
VKNLNLNQKGGKEMEKVAVGGIYKGTLRDLNPNYPESESLMFLVIREIDLEVLKIAEDN